MNESEEKIDLDEILKTIQSAKITPNLLGSLDTEDKFMFWTVEIAKEAGSLVSIVADIVPPGSAGWNRDSAIIVGNLIRLAKLISGQLDQVCKKRQETSFIFSRLIFETIVNIKFFIKNGAPELFDTYIRYSMRHEKKLQDLIKKEIETRGGVELPIERRMLNSIDELAKLSGISMETMSVDEPKNWGKENFYQRAKDVGLGTVYLGLYGGSSHGIHGNWMDLISYHLVVEGSFFIPKPSWNLPRPQILISTVLLSLETIKEYLAYIGCSSELPIIKRIDETFDKIRQLDSAHETFLSTK